MAKKIDVRGQYVRSMDNYVHIATVLVADTLCGYNDAGVYEDTDDPINCPLCIKQYNWVKNHIIPKNGQDRN